VDVTASIQLPAADRAELTRILGCTQNQLAERLKAYASAALTEYVSMVLGQKVFRRGSDIHEYRLFLMIDGVFKNQIPNEQEVCRLFQTTATESRSLIRSVMSKYQYQLKTAVERSMKDAVESAQDGDTGDNFTVTINSLNVVEELNRALAEIDGTLQPVAKKHGSVSTYKISPASHARLKQHLGLP
jgi:serine/threonine protein phosphatase PrpC